MRRRRGGGSPYQVLAAAIDEIGADGSPEGVLARLVRNLADGTGAEYVAVRSSVDGWPVTVTASAVPTRRGEAGADRVVRVPTGLPADVSGSAEPVSVVIAKPAGRPMTEHDELLLAGTAQCVGLLIRGVQLDAELGRRVQRTRELEAQLTASRKRLLAVHALERRRIVTELLSVSTPLLAGIRRVARECADALAKGEQSAPLAVERLGYLLEELIDRFRAMVRGVHSAVLADRGPVAALEELAADLPRPVHLAGELPGPVSREVAAVLYHVTAATLRVMTAGAVAEPVRVTFGWSSGRATVRVQGRVDSPTRLWAALAVDAAQLAALGGELERTVDEAGVAVLVSLPDRLQPPVGVPDAVAAPGAVRPHPATPHGAGPHPATPHLAGPHGAGPRAVVPAGWSPDGGIPPGDLLGRVRALLSAAVELYADEPGGADLAAAARRLDSPIRVALVGGPGAGTSTLVNALLGDELAATGRRPGSEFVIWFQQGQGRSATVHPTLGPPWAATAAATDPGAGVAWAGLVAAEVDHVTVEWPAPVLTGMTLIDVPGPDGPGPDRAGPILAGHGVGGPLADAVVHVVGRVGADGVPAAGGWTAGGGAAGGGDGLYLGADGPYPLFVLSHADTPGVPPAGVLRRHGVPAGVVLLDGRLAVAARTLRDAEYRALRALAAPPAPAEPLDGRVEDLLQRFGPAGLDAAVGLIRGGTVDGAAALATEMVRRSGLGDVLAMLDTHLRPRSDLLRARSALRVLGAVFRRYPLPGVRLDPLARELERIVAGAHELAELDTLAALRAGAVVLPAGIAADAERLLGASGPRPQARLGLDPAAGADAVRHAAAEEHASWRLRAEHPSGGPAARQACRTVVRTCEGLLAAEPKSA